MQMTMSNVSASIDAMQSLVLLIEGSDIAYIADTSTFNFAKSIKNR